MPVGPANQGRANRAGTWREGGAFATRRRKVWALRDVRSDTGETRSDIRRTVRPEPPGFPASSRLAADPTLALLSRGRTMAEPSRGRGLRSLPESDQRRRCASLSCLALAARLAARSPASSSAWIPDHSIPKVDALRSGRWTAQRSGQTIAGVDRRRGGKGRGSEHVADIPYVPPSHHRLWLNLSSGHGRMRTRRKDTRAMPGLRQTCPNVRFFFRSMIAAPPWRQRHVPDSRTGMGLM